MEIQVLIGRWRPHEGIAEIRFDGDGSLCLQYLFVALCKVKFQLWDISQHRVPLIEYFSPAFKSLFE